MPTTCQVPSLLLPDLSAKMPSRVSSEMQHAATINCSRTQACKPGSGKRVDSENGSETESETESDTESDTENETESETKNTAEDMAECKMEGELDTPNVVDNKFESLETRTARVAEKEDRLIEWELKLSLHAVGFQASKNLLDACKTGGNPPSVKQVQDMVDEVMAEKLKEVQEHVDDHPYSSKVIAILIKCFQPVLPPARTMDSIALVATLQAQITTLERQLEERKSSEGAEVRLLDQALAMISDLRRDNENLRAARDRDINQHRQHLDQYADSLSHQDRLTRTLMDNWQPDHNNVLYTPHNQGMSRTIYLTIIDSVQ
jgi:hypothetical protein